MINLNMITYFKFVTRININIVSKRTTIKIFSRGMIRLSGVATKLTPVPRPLNIAKRHHPGDFKPRRWTALTEDEKRRLNLTQHETTHTLIEETTNGNIVFLATSSKGLASTKGPFHKLSPEKMDGTFVPRLNPITKDPLMDDYGYPIPNPNKGGQYIAVLDTKRKLEKDMEHKCPIQKENQDYLDKHESELNKILLSLQKGKLPRNIGGQDYE